ncbi:MAG: DUF11 domain-containing protein [Candidatus Hydrogenedentes bacterium]|nr:DUF11 domain-containing protein [Candidatus Hydrogenedentota bacterium]
MSLSAPYRSRTACLTRWPLVQAAALCVVVFSLVTADAQAPSPKGSVLPDLALTLSDSVDPVIAGNSITYTIDLVNNGADATGVSVVMFAPASTFLVSLNVADGSGWGLGIIPDGSGGFGAEFANTGPIANGETAQFTVTVSVNGSTSSGTVITGLVNASSSQEDANAADNTASETTTVATQANLGVAVSDTPDPAKPGSNITYTVTLANAGASSAQDVTVTVPTPANTTYVSSTLTLGAGWALTSSPSVGGTGNVVYSKGVFNKNEGASFQIVVATDPGLSNGATVTATATAASTTTDPVPGNNSASATTTMATEADLSVGISDSPDPVTAGGTLTYTVPYENLGPNTATSVAVTVPVPTGATFVSAAVNSGASWTISQPAVGATGDVEFTKASSGWGDTAEFEVVVAIPPDTASGANINGECSVSSATTDPVAGNDSDSTTTTATTAVDLALSLADSPDPVTAGANITYTIAYDNNGPSNASSVTVLQAVPANTTFVSASVSSGTGWSISTPAVGGVGNIIFSKATSELSDTATFRVVVKVGPGTANGAVINGSASATSSTTEANAGDESENCATTVEAKADLALTLGDSPDPVRAGESIAYAITLNNNGPSDAANVTVSQAVPTNTTFVSASVTSGAGWSATTPSVGAAGNVQFSKAAFGSGASAEFEIVVLVAANTADGTNVSASATAQSATTEASPGNETGAASTTVDAVADLTVTLAGSPETVNPGDSITYTIDLANNGPSDATGASVTEAVPAGTTYVSSSVVTGTGWSATTPAVGATGNVVFSKAALPASETATFEVVVQVDGGASSGTTINASATAAATTTDPAPGSNTATNVSTVCGMASIVDYTDTEMVCEGETAIFTVTVDGDPAPDIQWQVDEGSGFVNIPGEDGTTLSFSATADDDGKVYRAFVSNNCSDTTSAETTLAVNTGTAVTLEPADVESCVGKKAAFTIEATGSPAPSIQWQVDDGSGFNDLPGETGATLRLQNVTEDMDGNVYRAVLSNACGADVETATATLTVLIPPAVSANQLVIGDNPASDYTSASDGTFSDKVQITWSAVDGADEYRVFRSIRDDFSNATAVTDWITDLVYDDFDVGTETVSSGCSSTMVPVLYYYQVKARGICGESELSGADTGYINVTKARYASALPSAIDNDGYHIAGVTDAIAVRLSAGEPIDPNTVWGTIYSETALEESAVSILPVAGSDGNDLWVQYTPEVPWVEGEKVTMTIGATTIAGRGAGPVAAVFIIESAAAVKLSALVYQPSYADFDASALARNAESNDEVYLSFTDSDDLPELVGSIGAAYAVGPEKPYAVQQRVWIPVPAGVSADGLEAYWLDRTMPAPRWVPGPDLEGWMSTPEHYVLELDGQEYLGVLVGHGGTVVLGPQVSDGAPSAKAAVGDLSKSSGLADFLVLALLGWAGYSMCRARWRIRRSEPDTTS